MNLLLDTHVVLWWLMNSPRLPDVYGELISDSNNLPYISTASYWEISIKKGLGKLTIPDSYVTILDDQGFRNLWIERNHVLRVESLPLIHRDPFDRLLIAQAIHEGMTLLSMDEMVKKYDVPML